MGSVGDRVFEELCAHMREDAVCKHVTPLNLLGEKRTHVKTKRKRENSSIILQILALITTLRMNRYTSEANWVRIRVEKSNIRILLLSRTRQRGVGSYE